MSPYIEDLYLVTPERPAKQQSPITGFVPESDSSPAFNAAAIISTPLQAYSQQPQLTPVASTASLSSSSSLLDHTPVSPTFSLRQSMRFPSANSSIAGSPVIRSSLDGYGKMKQPLTEVKEEKESIQGHIVRDQVSTIVEDIANKDYLDATSAFPDYDWVDTPPYEGNDFDFSASKRRCGGDGSPDGGMSARFTERFPSIAKKLKSKREKRTSSITGSMHETSTSRSRASSLRSPSTFDKNNDIPPTPPPIHQELVDTNYDSIMQPEEEADELEEEQRVALSRTPLLPPVLAFVKKEIEEPVQSPLQSPSVDATPSLPQSPCDSPHPFRYLPSPPLSTKPSVASFHHRSILPSADIPAINLADAQDEWSIRLGHGNFTITPEPYQLEGPVTHAACQRLKADWEEAKNNFEAHRERTAEVYNETSKTYHLTLVKWAEINLRWRSYHEEALDALPKGSQETPQPSVPSQDQVTPVAAIALDTPISTSVASLTSEAKFPTPGAGGIVGPMEQIKPMVPRTCRKRSFWRFLQGVWPSGNFGVSQA